MWEFVAGGLDLEEEGGEFGEEVGVGGEDVFAVEDWSTFGVDLFAGEEDVGAEAGSQGSCGWRREAFVRLSVLDEDKLPDVVSELCWEGEEMA